MNADLFPITKSFLCEITIASKLEASYLLSDVRCQLLTSTMRDVYLITSAQGKHILYIYRHDQRIKEEIIDEWCFVAYLFAHSIPVAPAILNKEKNILLEFNAPEGTRYGVLVRYVEGESFRKRPSPQAATGLGRFIAQAHLLADKMPAKLNRPKDEALHQLKKYVARFTLEFPYREENIAILNRAVDHIYAKTADLPTTAPYYGMIHGDVIRSNVQIDRHNRITILDFDLCGFGWRAYDIASFLLTLHGTDSLALKQSFKEGYNEVRQIDDLEQELMPLFKLMRSVVTIGIPVMNLQHWGMANIEPWFKYSFDNIDQAMKQLDGI